MIHLEPVANSDETSPVWPPANASIEGARKGERQALQKVLVVTYPKMAGYFAARGCSREEASDLASETLARVAEHISDLRDPGAYRTWVWRLAESVFRSWLRSETRFWSVRNRSISDHQPRPDELYELNEEEQRLRSAFISLDVRDQEALWMRYVEELSYSSIARIRGGSQTAARVATHRAKKRLEDLLDQPA